MGIRGLTTYISENSKLYLKPHELCDCYLVVDGCSVSCNLYKWLSKSHSAFGGDYDEYYKIVKDFFTMLKKCNVTPIVLLDGGYETKKIKTTLRRAKDRLPILRTFAKAFYPTKFHPIFNTNTFCDVMEELEILCLRCDFEADGEIAAIARRLNCPVLSYDSDFYIFDVLYIPLSTVHTTPVKHNDSNKYYVRCSIYDVTHFLRKFDGLDKSLLPIIATLLGNDSTDNSVFGKFFGHVLLPKNRHMPYTQRRIHGVLNWMKKENVESAVKQILNHSESKNAKKIVKIINSSISDYTDSSVSESVLEKLKICFGDISLKKKPLMLKLTPVIADLYSKCRVHKFIIDMITLRNYFTFQQVEYVYQNSSHFVSLQLISVIYNILAPYMKSKWKPLKIYLTIKNQYTAVTLKNDFPNSTTNVTLDEMLKESEAIRLKWLCYFLGLDHNDLEIVPKSEWSVFILSCIFWIKKLNSFISLAHIHALVLMAIANQVIQKCVGYVRNYSAFMKSSGNLLEKLKTQPLKIGEGKDFKEMLQDVTMFEKLILQRTLIPFRQSTEKAMGKAYCISTIHLFAAFQSCLFHIMQLNALLNYPLPHLRISDFYSGTLLFNFYLSVEGKNEVEKFGCNLFKDAPNLKTIYLYLSKSLCEYSEKADVVYEQPRIRKKNRRKKSLKKTEELDDTNIVLYESVHEEEEEENYDSSDYNDENNPYAVLHCGFNYKK